MRAAVSSVNLMYYKNRDNGLCSLCKTFGDLIFDCEKVQPVWNFVCELFVMNKLKNSNTASGSLINHSHDSHIENSNE